MVVDNSGVSCTTGLIINLFKARKHLLYYIVVLNFSVMLLWRNNCGKISTYILPMLQCRPTAHHIPNQEKFSRKVRRSWAHHSTKYARKLMCAASCCRYVGRTSWRSQEKINQHIPKFIRNNQKPTTIFPKRNCKENSIRPSLRNVTQ